MEQVNLTRDQAREMFWNLGLDYPFALRSAYINDLAIMINQELKVFNIGCQFPYMTAVNKKSIKVKWDERGLPVCFLTARGPYFNSRECISFNACLDDKKEHQWIGFSGNACDDNIQPVLRAFMLWCRYLVKQKEKE